MTENPINSIVHAELVSAAPDKTEAFFKNVFGWKFERYPGMDYAMWTSQEGELAGGMRPTQAAMGEPAQILNYVAVKNVNETVKRAEAQGATVLVPRQEVPGMGAFAIMKVPGEIPLGVWESVQ